jgi:hypothetical protein
MHVSSIVIPSSNWSSAQFQSGTVSTFSIIVSMTSLFDVINQVNILVFVTVWLCHSVLSHMISTFCLPPINNKQSCLPLSSYCLFLGTIKTKWTQFWLWCIVTINISYTKVRNLNKFQLLVHNFSAIYGDNDSGSSDSEGSTCHCKSAPTSTHLLGNFEVIISEKLSHIYLSDMCIV